MTDIRQITALAALNTMLKQKHFSICTIRELVTMFDVVPDAEAMKVLTPLHCVNYADMPPELYAALPSIIERALSGSPLFQFELKREAERPTLVIEGQKKPGLIQRPLGRSTS